MCCCCQLLASKAVVAQRRTSSTGTTDDTDPRVAVLQDQIAQLELDVLGERKKTAAADAEADERAQALEAEIGTVKRGAAAGLQRADDQVQAAAEAAAAAVREASDAAAAAERGETELRARVTQLEVQHMRELEQATTAAAAALSQLAREQDRSIEQLEEFSKSIFWLSAQMTEAEAEEEVDGSGVILGPVRDTDWRAGWGEMQALVLDRQVSHCLSLFLLIAFHSLSLSFLLTFHCLLCRRSWKV